MQDILDNDTWTIRQLEAARKEHVLFKKLIDKAGPNEDGIIVRIRRTHPVDPSMLPCTYCGYIVPLHPRHVDTCTGFNSVHLLSDSEKEALNTGLRQWSRLSMPSFRVYRNRGAEPVIEHMVMDMNDVLRNLPEIESYAAIMNVNKLYEQYSMYDITCLPFGPHYDILKNLSTQVQLQLTAVFIQDIDKDKLTNNKQEKTIVSPTPTQKLTEGPHAKVLPNAVAPPLRAVSDAKNTGDLAKHKDALDHRTKDNPSSNRQAKLSNRKSCIMCAIKKSTVSTVDVQQSYAPFPINSASELFWEIAPESIKTRTRRLRSQIGRRSQISLHTLQSLVREVERGS